METPVIENPEPAAEPAAAQTDPAAETNAQAEAPTGTAASAPAPETASPAPAVAATAAEMAAEAAAETPELPEPTNIVSLEELQAQHERVVPGPSGFLYKVRAINLQRHALSGGFPASLQQLAIKQALGESIVRPEDELLQPSELIARYAELGDYFDEIVRATIVEPALVDPPENAPIKDEIRRLRALAREADDAESLRPQIEALRAQLLPDPVSYLPPEDYDWAVQLALGSTNVDGNGRPVFGRAALSSFREGRNE